MLFVYLTRTISEWQGLIREEQSGGNHVLLFITRFLEKRLKLMVNKNKSQVVHVNQCTFLGFGFKRNNIIVHSKSLEKFKREIRRLTGRSWGASMATRFQKLKLYMQGWMNYFAIGMRYQQACDLDQWIRRRIRMCFWADSLLLDNCSCVVLFTGVLP